MKNSYSQAERENFMKKRATITLNDANLAGIKEKLKRVIVDLTAINSQ